MTPPKSVFKRRKNVGKPKSNNSNVSVSVNEQVVEPQSSTSDNNQNSKDTPSSSKKKLADYVSNYDCFLDDKNDKSELYDIINLRSFELLLGKIARCVECGGSITVSPTSRLGLSFVLNLKCTKCSFEVSESNGKQFKRHNNPAANSDVNARLVYALCSIGRGEEAAKMLCGIMNFPNPPSFKYYYPALSKAAEDICGQSMRQAVEESVEFKKKEAYEENSEERDISACFDGSWQRRGHVSLNGIVSAISPDTCKVLDIEVLTKYCRCKGRLKNEHEDKCVANHSGTSGAMETNGVLRIFQRSQTRYNIRYQYYLGDGDSSAHTTVDESKPYGDDFPIHKLECVGHVQKRMGARLRNLKSKAGKRKLEDGKTMGGQKRLTNAVINTMQIYYGLAIRRNTTDLEKMRLAVWAEFFHLESSDEKANHGLCPKGKDSWCKYQIAVANKEKYEHSKHTHLPKAVMNEVKPIFRDLANRELLQKCLHGGTQNSNESLNNIIWSRIPKTTFVMKSTLQFGAYEAVCCYNDGNITKCRILNALCINPGRNCVQTMINFDEARIKRAEKAADELQKKIRQNISGARKRLEDKFEEEEGQDNPMYNPGMH